jgi:hypothetical protein
MKNALPEGDSWALLPQPCEDEICRALCEKAACVPLH